MMKAPALCISRVFVSTKRKSSADDSGDSTGFVVTAVVIILTQPKPELNMKKVQANRDAFRQEALPLGIHLLKK
jgi:hypothetical protein